MSIKQVGRELILRFKLPVRATDGRDLTKPIEVEIFRHVSRPGQAAPAVSFAARPWVHLRPPGLARFQRGPLFVYDQPLLPGEFASEIGDTLSFMVITLTRSFRGRPRASDPSNIAQITLLNVSPAVAGLKITQAPGAIDLRWQPPGAGLAGGPLPRLAGYRIYRGGGGFSASMPLLGETASPHYADTHFRFGQTYAYSVRAVFKQGETTAESAGSAPVEITPRKIFPPSPPQGLTGVYTGRAVQLIWNTVAAPELAGYNVYRRAPGGKPERLNSVLVRTPVFQDAHAAPDREYEYWVTAVDLEHNESQPSKSITVETR